MAPVVDAPVAAAPAGDNDEGGGEGALGSCGNDDEGPLEEVWG